MPTYRNAHAKLKKWIYDIQYPGNRFESVIISNDFWSSTIWAIRIHVSFACSNIIQISGFNLVITLIVNSQKDQFQERMKPSKFILNYTLLNWLKLMKLVKLWKPNCGSSSDGNVLFFDAELNIPVYPILSQLRYWVIFLTFHRYFEISDQKFQDQKSRKTGILFQINEC